MRPLQPSEKRLALMLATCLLVAGGLFGFTMLKREKTRLQSEWTLLQNTKIEADVWVQEQQLWNDRHAWLEAHQPAAPEPGAASVEVLNQVREAATRHGLKILEQSMLEPESTPHAYSVGLKIKVSTTLEPLARWMAELQQPSQFYAVTAFTLKSDKEPPGLICDLQVAKLYAPRQP